MDQQKPFIIVVDDDDEDRYLLHYCFSEIGLDDNVKFFGDALQYIKYMELIDSLQVKPSLVILDYKMPHMNGKALVNYLKTKASFSEIPLVILSSTLTPEIIDKLMDMGVTACYQKQSGYEKLRGELEEIIKFATPVAHR